LIQRHRLVMAALAEEMKGPIHALTLDVKTPEEAGR
jgi:stress-induced morphogen